MPNRRSSALSIGLLAALSISVSGCASEANVSISCPSVDCEVSIDGEAVGRTPVTRTRKITSDRPLEVVVNPRVRPPEARPRGVLTLRRVGAELRVVEDGKLLTKLDLREQTKTTTTKGERIDIVVEMSGELGTTPRGEDHSKGKPPEEPRIEAEDLRNPKFKVTFKSISEPDRKPIQDGMRCKDDLTGSPDFALTFKMGELEQNPFTLQQLFDFIRERHKAVCELRSPSGGQIVRNIGVEVELTYGSNSALARSAARIAIKVEPSDADLRINIPTGTIPDLDSHRSGGEGEVVETNNGSFEMTVPFAFIRRNSHIYFTTTKNAITRYFEYDLETQQQRGVAGIGTVKSDAEDWAYYRAHRKLPNE